MSTEEGQVDLGFAATRLRDALPDAVVDVGVHRGDTTIVVAAERIVEVCRLLRDDPELRFDYLLDVTAVDWLHREPRFDVVYHLFSISRNDMLRVKIRVEDRQPVDSLAEIFLLANWGERETYDMFGINFAGHPDLRRILLPEDWEDGFPLRKDFAIGGYGIWAADNVPFR